MQTTATDFGLTIINKVRKSWDNPLSHVLGIRPLVFVGEASYALYLLHFNFWNQVHDSHVLERVGLAKYDPWISYFILVAMALVALHVVEKPAQRQLRKWMKVG